MKKTDDFMGNMIDGIAYNKFMKLMFKYAKLEQNMGIQSAAHWLYREMDEYANTLNYIEEKFIKKYLEKLCDGLDEKMDYELKRRK